MTFSKSKWIDGIREYSDTAVRLLSATGLFKFKNLPELFCQDILSTIFDIPALRNNIFGEMTEEQYYAYECQEDFFFGKNLSITEIFGYSENDTQRIITNIESHLGGSSSKEAKSLLQNKKKADFLCHIKDKYPKDKIIKLLPLFSDRKKDNQIKQEVNDAVTVPTIYEYIMGIAWYYISNEDFDLYHSLNLTLNADFEPVIHAGSGDGDILDFLEKNIHSTQIVNEVKKSFAKVPQITDTKWQQEILSALSSQSSKVL